MVDVSLIELINQAGIAVFGLSAIILVARKNKWGFVLGLLSQPFFLMTSFINRQWGLFIVSIIYTGTWAYGIYRWFKDDKKKGSNKKPKY